VEQRAAEEQAEHQRLLEQTYHVRAAANKQAAKTEERANREITTVSAKDFESVRSPGVLV
jgi:hypothetical protein